MKTFSFLLSTIMWVISPNFVSGQIYDCDSMIIKFGALNRSSIYEKNDLNISIIICPKPGNSRSYAYDKLIVSNRSTLGNCYFELYKFDSTERKFENITQYYSGPTEEPVSFSSEEELLKTDLPKSFIKAGKSRALKFNLLNEVNYLARGDYTLKIYFRVGNKFGLNAKGNIIDVSLFYLESSNINFTVVKDLSN